MAWKFDTGQPLYVQITAELKRRIADGTYPVGQKMPSVRELALEAGVNPNTMQRALADLEREGLLQSERTAGRFVRATEAAVEKLNDALRDEAIERFVHEMEGLGIESDQIVSTVSAWIERNALWLWWNFRT